METGLVQLIEALAIKGAEAGYHQSSSSEDDASSTDNSG